MKSSFKAFMALILIVAFYACKKDIETTNPAKNDAITSSKKGDSIVHKLVIDRSINYILEVNGTFYYADDITLSTAQFNTLKKLTVCNLSTQERSTIVQNFASTWPNATVYYSYPDRGTMTADEYNSFVATVNTALTNLTNATGIQFIERTNQPEYIKYVQANVNNSPLGWRQNGVNTINIASYNSVGIVMHETMHSLGVAHEQCRPDRDLYIIVDATKVIAGYENNYNKSPGYAGHGPFDFGSLMIYSSTDGARDANNPPMTRLDGTTFVKQRDALSQGDINGLKSLYFPTTADDVYRISPVYASTKSIDIYGDGGKAEDGTKLIIWDSHSNNNQKFVFTKDVHGYFQIKSLLDPNKVLTVRDASTASGTQVEFRTIANTDNQKFKLYNRGNDGFSFAPKHADELRLEVSGGSSANGANIVVSTSNTDSQAQRFSLTKF